MCSCTKSLIHTGPVREGPQSHDELPEETGLQQLCLTQLTCWLDSGGMESGVMVSKPPNNFVPTKLSPSPQPISGLRPTALFPPLVKLCILPGVPFSCYCPHFLLHPKFLLTSENTKSHSTINSPRAENYI